MFQSAERTRTRSGKTSAEASLSDSGFASPSAPPPPQIIGSSATEQEETPAAAAAMTRSASLDETFIMSPLTTLVRCEASSSTPLLSGSGQVVPPCQYFLRRGAPHRWASTPLLQKVSSFGTNGNQCCGSGSALDPLQELPGSVLQIRIRIHTCKYRIKWRKKISDIN